MAKALQDSRLLDIPLSPLLYRLALQVTAGQKQRGAGRPLPCPALHVCVEGSCNNRGVCPHKRV